MARSRVTLKLSALAHALAFALLLACAGEARAQTPAAAVPQAPGSISGRVTLKGGERGLAGINVLLMPSDYGPRWKPLARTATDSEGRYRLTSVAPGRYQVVASAPAYVVENAPGGWPPGRAVTLSPGESVEDADFTLARGGVITGRVTDSDGRPVVEEQVNLVPLDTKVMARLPHNATRTDDRGVYRAYGLPAGRYHASVGQAADNSMVRVGGGGGRHYPRTFHPAAADESQARVVEVTEGGEAADVDITLGKATRTVAAAGRIVHAETGRPAAGVRVGVAVIERQSGRLGAYGSGLHTNARGEFRVETLVPGERYGVFAEPQGAAEWYSDVTTFEAGDSDVSGLEVKLHRGATLSGTVVVEGAGDRATAARLLSRFVLYSGTFSDALAAPAYTPAAISPDGTFRMTGLRPGRTQLYPASPFMPKGLSMVRVERDGVEQTDGIEVAEGAHVSGVRVVLAYGTGVVRGQVIVRRGGEPAPLPEGARLYAFARPAGSHALRRRPVEVDPRGRFLFEGVQAGAAEVTVICMWPGWQARATQAVNVADGAEASVTVTLDLSQPERVNDR